MKQLRRTLFVGGLALSLSAMSAALHAQDNLGNLEALIFEASHSEVTMTDDGVARIGWTRADVPVMVDGMRLDPPAGLGSWAAFKPVAITSYSTIRRSILCISAGMGKPPSWQRV